MRLQKTCSRTTNSFVRTPLTAKCSLRTFSLSQMNNVELARTLPWRENALFEGREKNDSINLFFAPYSEVVLTLNISTNWEEFMSLYCKTKINTPTMHEVPNYEVRLSLKLCPICLWQNVAMLQKATWLKLFHTFSTSWEPGCQWQIISAFAWCCLRWPWAACPATDCAGGSKRTCSLRRCTLTRVCSILVLSNF